MFSLIQSLLQQCRGSFEYNICILGLNQSGKTALFNAIKHFDENKSISKNQESGTIITYKPTIGLNVMKYKNGRDNLTIWDLGGKASIRKIWENYYPECHGVIYMFSHNIQEGIQTMKTALAHQEMAKIPLALITINQNEKQALQPYLNQLDCLKGRQYTTHHFPVQKMTNMKYLSNLLRHQIKEMLHSLYLDIRKLHQEIKE